jgi:hypothetical protein
MLFFMLLPSVRSVSAPLVRQAVVLMQRSRSQADVLSACDTLGKIAEGHEGRIAIVDYQEGEALQAVTTAMSDFGGHPDLLASACNFISHMSMGNGARVALAQQGAAELIVAAINTHHEHAKLLEYACGALINLAIDRSISIHIGAAGGIRAVMQSLVFATSASDVSLQDKVPGSSHEVKGEVQHDVLRIGLAALSNLAAASSNAELIGEEDGVCVCVS